MDFAQKTKEHAMLLPPEKNDSSPTPDRAAVQHPWVIALFLTGMFVFAMLGGAGNIFSSNNTEAVIASPSGKADSVSPAQRLAIESEFIKYTAKFEAADPNDADIERAILSSPLLTREQAQLLLQSAKTSNIQLGTITLWDNFDQDGDVIQISTAGLTLSVPLMHTPQTYYIPFERGAPIQISGLVDGGGGITAAIGTNSGQVPLPIMAVGQTIIIPNF